MDLKGTVLEIFYAKENKISKPRLKIPIDETDNKYMYISADEENLKRIEDENIKIPYHWFIKYLEM